MNGICGWLGHSPSLTDATATLRAMSCGLSPEPAHEMQRNNAAVLTRGRHSDCHSAGQHIVVLCGRPERISQPGAEISAADLYSLYTRHSTDFLRQLRGSFALAIFNLQEQTALFAVDPIGLEPLCLAPYEQGVAFASRADGLSYFPAFERELDPQSIYHYLFFHCVPSPKSIFRHQFKLQPGQYAFYRDGRLETNFYWQVPYDDTAKSFNPLREQFLSLQEKVVCRYAGPESTGSFLSGGTDSSTITGFLSKCQQGNAASFSIGFAADGYDEMEYARIASTRFHTKAHEYYVGEDDVLEAIPLIARAYDEPFGNASAIPTYFCAKLAAENGVQQLLAGDGGDEIFGGNERYVRQKILGYYGQLPAALRPQMLESMLLGGRLGRIAPFSKLKSYIEQAKQALPDRLEAYNLLHRFSAEHMFTREFLDLVDPSQPITDMRATFQRTNSGNDLHRILNMEMKFVLADNDLRKVSRMCNLAGVDVRYPLLDLEMVEFAATVPAELKIKQHRLRYFFKKSLQGFLPPEILHKSKHGFGLPFGVWLRDYQPLQAIARDSLVSFEARGYLQPQFIEELLRKHREEHAAYYGVLIWVLMMLEQWLQAQGL